MFRVNLLVALLAILLLAGCFGSRGPGGSAGRDGPPGRDADGDYPDVTPRREPITRAGNKNPYTVLGKTYHLLPTAEGYREVGIASWYGTKFHGRATSNGEAYDMFAMTAAHKTLPIPAYVRVTNLENGRSAIVRVNDRGPFHSDRIIDLSYVAAAKLDLARKGSGLVIVERVFPGEAPLAAPTLAATAPTAPVATPLPPPAPVIVTSTVIPESGELYLQLAAFSSLENAEIFRARMARELDWNREPIQVIQRDNLFRVRMGPYRSREEADAVAAQVRQSHDFSPVIQKP